MACHVQEAKKKQSFNFPGRFFILFRRYLQQIYTSHTCIFNIAHKTFKSVGLVRVKVSYAQQVCTYLMKNSKNTNIISVWG